MSPERASGAAAAAAAEQELPSGTVVGRYLVIQRLGRGGMGTVYSAFDPHLDRKVAIKVLRRDLGRNHEQFRARMLREAQAMARLSHPNVLSVHDVGTFGERVFLAMELVEGGTVKTWMRQQARPWREVVRVFLGAGRGLAAAHSAGLIHRDFKPDNILLGADHRARVTDFGLARWTGARTDEDRSTLEERMPARAGAPDDEDDSDLRPIEAPAIRPGHDRSDSPADPLASSVDPLTRAGTMLGTPGYMPPEQAMARPTDARGDQFSFCASLHEALYGVRAFVGGNQKELIAATIAGRVREEPADTRVPAWVRRILLRGLSLDPEARYPSMNALLEELARDPARRRARWLGGAALLTLVALLVVGAQRWGARREPLCQGAQKQLADAWSEPRRAALRLAFAGSLRPYAAFAQAETERGLDTYVSAWSSMHRDACEATRVRGEQTEEAMALRMGCLDDRRKELRALTELLASADDQTIEQAVQAVGALPPVAACADVKALSAVAPPPAEPAVRARIDEERTHLAAARGLLGAGKYAAGLAMATRAADAATQIGYRPLAAEALALVGELRLKAGDYQGADRSFRDAWLAAEETRQDDLKCTTALRLATLSVDVRGYDQAREWLRTAEACTRRIGGGGELQAELWVTVAQVHFRASRYGEAETAAQRAVALASQLPEPSDLQRARAHRTLGDVLNYSGRYAEGLRSLEQARALAEHALGAEHPEVASILRREIDAYSLQHDGEHGLELGRRVLTLLGRSLPPDHLQIAQAHTNVAESLGLLGRHEEAIAEERLALPTYERVFGPTGENVGVSLTNIGYSLLRLGRTPESRVALTRAAAIFEKTLPAGSPAIAEPLLRLGQLELRESHPKEAALLLERARGLRAKDADPTEMLADCELGLAEALWPVATARSRARELAALARDQLRAGGKNDRAAKAEAWLTTHVVQ